MTDFRHSTDTYPISEFKQNAQDIIEHPHESGRPVYLTVNGKTDSVLLDVHAYETLLLSSNMAAELTFAETDIKEGSVRPMREFMAEFKRGKNISG